MGYLKSQKLDVEIKEIEEREEKENAKVASANARTFDFGKYAHAVSTLPLHTLPDIPSHCYNAIVINLFCID